MILVPLLAIALGISKAPAMALDSLIPDVTPGPAFAQLKDGVAELRNKALNVSWAFGNPSPNAPIIENGYLQNQLSNEKVTLGLPFQALLSDDTRLWPFGMKLVGKPEIKKITGDPASPLADGRANGQSVVVVAEDAEKHVRVQWTAALLDEANYVRQEVIYSATGAVSTMKRAIVFSSELPDASVRGLLPSSPISTETTFWVGEDSSEESKVVGNEAGCVRTGPLVFDAKHPITCRSVIGVAPAGQIRRGFLNYVARARALSWPPFASGWHQVGFFAPVEETTCLSSMKKLLAVVEANGPEARAWMKANEDVFADAHFIGSDPRLGGVFGLAAWNMRKGILVLSNPGGKAQSFSFDVERIFELPKKHPRSFSLRNPETPAQTPLKASPGKQMEVVVQAGQSLVFEAVPGR